MTTTKKPYNWKEDKTLLTKWYAHLLGAPILIFAGKHIHHDLTGAVLVGIGGLATITGMLLMAHHKKTEGWVFISDWTETKKRWGILSYMKLRKQREKDGKQH